MDIATIVKILDIMPDAEVVVQRDGSMLVRRGRRSGTFVVQPDGTLRPRGTPPPLPAVNPFADEKTPVVTTGSVNG